MTRRKQKYKIKFSSGDVICGLDPSTGQYSESFYVRWVDNDKTIMGNFVNDVGAMNNYIPFPYKNPLRICSATIK